MRILAAELSLPDEEAAEVLSLVQSHLFVVVNEEVVLRLLLFLWLLPSRHYGFVDHLLDVLESLLEDALDAVVDVG